MTEAVADAGTAGGETIGNTVGRERNPEGWYRKDSNRSFGDAIDDCEEGRGKAEDEDSIEGVTDVPGGKSRGRNVRRRSLVEGLRGRIVVSCT